MPEKVCQRWTLIAVSVVFVALGWPTPATAQTVSGQASVVQATVSGLFGPTTTVLADTGALVDSSDARQASQLTGNVPNLVTGGVLHAATIGSPDQVDSEASLADLALTVGFNTIGADFVMSRASAMQGAAGAGRVEIDGLSINGVPITVTGDPNQTIAIPGGQVVIYEQRTSATSTAVNALHVIVNGVADVVIGSATAGVQ